MPIKQNISVDTRMDGGNKIETFVRIVTTCRNLLMSVFAWIFNLKTFVGLGTAYRKFTDW
jgi:hypothetical protein